MLISCQAALCRVLRAPKTSPLTLSLAKPCGHNAADHGPLVWLLPSRYFGVFGRISGGPLPQPFLPKIPYSAPASEPHPSPVLQMEATMQQATMLFSDVQAIQDQVRATIDQNLTLIKRINVIEQEAPRSVPSPYSTFLFFGVYCSMSRGSQ